MTNLFKRAAVFTDIHLGEKSNSHQFLADCERYITWFIDLVRSEDCDMILFLGDFHHHRNSININTMNVSLRCLERLNDLGLPVMFIPGNHDLYHKDRRTLTSVGYINKFSNFNLIMDQVTIDDVCFVPWLIGEEHKNMKRVRAKYVMGHFELPGYMMNAMVEMPDHGGDLKADDFGNVDLVFTGHFHKRQNKRNVHYIGNAFPHNYADAWDDARGAMILTWGEEPVYHDWTEAPRYRVVNLGRLIDEADTLLNERTYARINIDIPISYEEATFIKETMLSQHGCRELTLIPAKKALDMEGVAVDNAFETVDQIVINQIQTLDGDHYDKRLLMDIYNNL
jgi:DNA repair exonuclease SbcCD nuclease subunit